MTINTSQCKCITVSHRIIAQPLLTVPKVQRGAHPSTSSVPVTILMYKGVFIATQLNSTQLTQLNSVQPSQSCFCLWRHDLQTESTGSLRSLIDLSWVELCRYKRALKVLRCSVPTKGLTRAVHTLIFSRTRTRSATKLPSKSRMKMYHAHLGRHIRRK